MGDRGKTVLALTGLVVACPVLLVFAVPRTAFDEDGVSLDRMIGLVDVPGPLHAVVVFLGASIFVGSLGFLSSSPGRGQLGWSDVRWATAFAGAGTYTAFTYRVAAAAVGGANIGAGMLFMLGMVLVPGLVAYGVIEIRAAERP